MLTFVRRSDGSTEGYLIRYPAEQQVLWVLEAALESALPEILSGDYNNLLNEGRRKIDDLFSDIK